MFKILISSILLSAYALTSSAQIIPTNFGKGLQVTGKDSSYYLKFGFRFQNLFQADWTLDTPEGSDNFDSGFLIRRSRFKFDGWALSPNIIYKFEVGLSNRDIGGGSGPEFRRTANMILDASVAWTFHKHWTIQFGQRKLPGNRERVVSSGNLQFVDRSILNSRYNIDRDMGLQLKHHFYASEKMFVQSTFAFSQGEGRNVTAGHFEGWDYTYKLEVMPFGKFKSKGAYVGSDIKRTATPKLAIAVSYDHNVNAVRERGQLGSFIKDDNGNYYGKTLNTLFVDFMYKHKGFSMMGEYAYKTTSDDISQVTDNEGNIVGTFFTGTGLNLQAGYLFDNNIELAGRYTTISPDENVANKETNYTFGVSKYIVGHKLKIQTDFTYQNIADSNDHFIWRTQMDFHF